MAGRSPQDEAELDASRAPLLDHLIELRTRIIRSLIAFLLAFLVCYFFAKNIYGFLSQPLANALKGQPNNHMIYTAVYETFFTYVKVGMFGALCIAFPYMATQIWLFIAPGLYRHERRAFLPFLAATPLMFLAGAAFVYYVMLPTALRFFLSFQSTGESGGMPIELQAKVADWLSFVMTLIFAFGFCFELPVLLMLLGRVGIVTSAALRKARRYGIVGIFVVAAVVTPPDVFSQLSLALPLVALYEVSIWGVWLMEKRRAKAESESQTAIVPSPGQ